MIDIELFPECTIIDALNVMCVDNKIAFVCFFLGYYLLFSSC